MSVNLIKHMKKTTVALSLSALLMPYASAESLMDALTATYMHSSEIKEAIDSLKAANEQEAQARSGYRPTLTMDASLVRSDTNPSGDYETAAKNNAATGVGAADPVPSKEGNTSRTAGLTVRQNLFQGGNTHASIQQAQANIKAARARLAKVVQDALFETVKAYVNTLTKMEEIRALEVNFKTKKATLQATRDKFNVGEETRTSVAQAEAENAAAEASLELAQAELDGFKATYMRLTGKTPGQLEGVQKPAQLPGSVQSIIDRAILNHPSIIQASFEETSARREIDKLNSNLLPKVDAFASTKRTENDISRMWSNPAQKTGLDYKRNSNRTEQQIGVQFSLNLYDGGLYRAQKRGAAHTAEQKRQAIETLRRQITERIYAVWELFKTAEQRVKLYKAQVAANKVALSGTEEELRVGSKILLDVLNAQSKLVEAQLNLAKAENQYYQSAYELISLMGGLQPKELQLKVKAYDPEMHYQEVRYRW